jgi:hypothetical protein
MTAPNSIATSGTTRDIPRVPDSRVTYSPAAAGASSYIVSAAKPAADKR